jgi:hypothetical protein
LSIAVASKWASCARIWVMRLPRLLANSFSSRTKPNSEVQ